jgi:nitrate/nitrite transporter NarK
VGGVLAGVAVPALVLGLGWRGTALVCAGLCFLLALAVAPLRRRLDDDADPRAPAERGVPAAIRLVLQRAALRRLALASLAFSAIQLCFSSFVVTFLVARVRLDLVSAGAVMALAQAAGVGARILWGWVADRLLPPRSLLMLLGFMMAVAGAVTGLIGEAWPLAAIVAVTMVLGASALGWNGVYLAEVAQLAPAGAVGAATGGALSLTFLGIVIGPPLFSALVAATGSYRPAFLAAATAAALAALTLRRR